MENRYILKKGDYYLSELSYDYERKIIKTLIIDNDYRKLYNDFEDAEEDRKLIFIETGLNLEVKKFKEEEK